jgi:ATPase family associated with various cellular activities (AAA)
MNFVTNLIYGKTPVMSYVDQAAKFVTEQTGLDPTSFATSALSKASEIKAKATEVLSNAMPTLTEVEKIVKETTGFDKNNVIENINKKVQYVNSTISSTEGFIKAVNDLDVPGYIGNFTSGAKEQLYAAKDSFAEFYATPNSDTTWKIAPYVIGATLVGVGSYVLYKKVRNYLDTPNLVSENKQIGVYAQTKECVSNVASGVWNTAKAGLKYGAGALGAGLASVKLAETIGPLVTSAEVITSAEAMKLYGITGLASLGIATAAMALKVGSSVGGKIKESFSTDPKPAFDYKTHQQVDTIISEAKNLIDRGGTFENVMIYGKSSSGKTMTAKHIADNLPMNFLEISGKNLADGSRAAELKNVLENAKNGSSPTLVFIDDAELISDQEIIDLLAKQSGSNKVMLVIAAKTDKPIPALLKGMDHQLFLDRPNLSARKAIINEYLPFYFSNEEISEVFTAEVMENIANPMEGLSSSQIAKAAQAIENSKKASDKGVLTKKLVTESIQKFIKKEKVKD